MLSIGAQQAYFSNRKRQLRRRAALVNVLLSPTDFDGWWAANVTHTKLSVREQSDDDAHAVSQELAKAPRVIQYRLTFVVRAVGGRSVIAVAFSGDDYATATACGFDLAAGQAYPYDWGMGAPEGYATAVGDGFYKCSMLFTSTAAAVMPVNLYVSPDAAETDYPGDPDKGLDFRGEVMLRETQGFPYHA